MFRGEDNSVGVADPYCPHLGAHLGHGGRVCGDYNPITGWASGGPDGVIAVDLQAGETLSVTYWQIIEDASVYILPDPCDIDEALVGADDTFYGGEEVTDYTSADGGRYYVVLDNWADGGAFAVELEIN